MLAKSKLNSNETLVSQALTNMEISYEKINAITKEKKIREDKRKCEKYKRKIRIYETNV